MPTPIAVIEGEARLDLGDDDTLSVVAKFGATFIHHETDVETYTFGVPAGAREWLGRALLAVRP